MILKCNCTSYLGGLMAGASYQDKTYGVGMRVHNPIMKEPKDTHWKCTICNTEHSKGSGEPDKKRER